MGIDLTKLQKDPNAAPVGRASVTGANRMGGTTPRQMGSTTPRQGMMQKTGVTPRSSALKSGEGAGGGTTPR